MHTSKHFDAELEQLRKAVLAMGGLAEQQIRYAVAALRSQDAELIEEVLRDEHRLNQMEREIDEACAQLIARRAPTAHDLRFVLMVHKAITDLERVGDEAKKIAKRARYLRLRPDASPGYAEIEAIAGIVAEMLRRALDAFARGDVSEVPQVLRQDHDVNERFHALLRALPGAMAAQPDAVAACVDMLWVAKALERVGDHAKNLCVYAVYMAKGEDVRYIAVEELEQRLRR